MRSSAERRTSVRINATHVVISSKHLVDDGLHAHELTIGDL